MPSISLRACCSETPGFKRATTLNIVFTGVRLSAGCELLDPQEATLAVSFEHLDFFTKNLSSKMRGPRWSWLLRSRRVGDWSVSRRDPSAFAAAARTALEKVSGGKKEKGPRIAVDEAARSLSWPFAVTR